MGREIDKQKLKIRLSSFWPLLILIVGIGLNSQKIQGIFEKRFEDPFYLLYVTANIGNFQIPEFARKFG